MPTASKMPIPRSLKSSRNGSPGSSGISSSNANHQRNALESQLKKFKAQIKQLEVSIEEKTLELSNAESSVSSLTSELDSVRSDLLEARQELQRYNQTVESVNPLELESIQNEVSELESNLDLLLREKANWEEELKRFEEDREEWKKEDDRLRKKISQLVNENETILHSRKQLDKSTQEQLKTVGDLRTEISTLKQANSQLETELQATKQQHTQALASADSMEQRVYELTQKLSVEIEGYKQSQISCSELETRVQSLTLENEGLAERLDSTRDELSSRNEQEELSSTEKQYLSQKLILAQNQADSVQQSLEQEKARTKDLELQVEELKKQVEIQAGDLKSAHLAQTGEKDNLLKISLLKEEIVQLKTDKAKVVEDLAKQAEYKQKELLDTNMKMEKELNVLKPNYEASKVRVDSLNKELFDMKNQNTELQSKASQLEMALSDANIKLSEYTNERQKYMKMLENYEKQISDHEKSIQLEKLNRENLNIEINSLRDRNNIGIESTIENFVTQIQKAKQKIEQGLTQVVHSKLDPEFDLLSKRLDVAIEMIEESRALQSRLHSSVKGWNASRKYQTSSNLNRLAGNQDKNISSEILGASNASFKSFDNVYQSGFSQEKLDASDTSKLCLICDTEGDHSTEDCQKVHAKAWCEYCEAFCGHTAEECPSNDQTY